MQNITGEFSRAIFECVNVSVAREIYIYSKDILSFTIANLSHDRVHILNNQIVGRFVILDIVGDAATVYWTCFKYAESRLHQIAFIGSIRGNRAIPCHLLDDIQSARLSSNPNRVQTAYRNGVINRFIECVSLNSYTSDERFRIIRMCALGVHTVDSERRTNIVLNVHADVRDPYWYQRHLSECMSIISEEGKDDDGAFTLIRAMTHFICLEDSRSDCSKVESLKRKISAIGYRVL